MIREETCKDLSGMNTFRMKVSCARYIDYDSPEDLLAIDFERLPGPVLSLGGGSNLLFLGDFVGTVLHSSIGFIREIPGEGAEVIVEAGAGVVFDSFVDWSCSRGLWGAENLSLIPGTVGAAAVQNIGAYGVEVRDIIEKVACFDIRERCFVEFRCDECGYGYRRSHFKKEWKGRYIVTSVFFRLSSIPCPKLGYGNLASMLQGREGFGPGDVRDAVSAIRRSKLPDPSETGSAGSFFMNPVVSKEAYEHLEAVAKAEFGEDMQVPHFIQEDGIKVPAAWMIEKCGLKGLMIGGAALHERQPLVIVNLIGEATPEEIVALERRVIESVKDKFGVDLHPEVEHV